MICSQNDIKYYKDFQLTNFNTLKIIVAVGKVSVASNVVQHDKQDANALRKVDVLDALLHKGKGLRFFFD